MDGPKIDAVFSLAQSDVNADTVDTETDDVFNSPDLLLPDDEKEEVDIMSGIDSTPISKADHFHILKKMLAPPVKVLEDHDPDAPPDLSPDGLLLHHDDGSMPPFVSHVDANQPPVLERENTSIDNISGSPKEHRTPRKKPCRKIAPSYIALINIDPFMKSKAHISNQLFRREFKECPNVCKKMYFKRNLEAGEDVFNVKTPSRQKHIFNYLMDKGNDKFQASENETLNCSPLKDIFENHDLKLKARRDIVGQPLHSRVCRTISRTPQDFTHEIHKLTDSENVSVGVVEESRDIDDMIRSYAVEIQKRNRKLECHSLRRLIELKRWLNHHVKRCRKKRSESCENFLKADVKSSLSGRVRKVNMKYRHEFVVGKKDLMEAKSSRLIGNLLNQIESVSRKKTEKTDKNNEYFIRYKRQLLTPSEKSNPRKRQKVTDVVIDSVEECTEQISSKPKPMKKKRGMDVVIDNPEDCTEKRIMPPKPKKKITDDAIHNAKRYKEKRVRPILPKGSPSSGNNTTDINYPGKGGTYAILKEMATVRDGILIKDLPNEKSTINRILNGVCEEEQLDRGSNSNTSFKGDSGIKKELEDYNADNLFLKSPNDISDSNRLNTTADPSNRMLKSSEIKQEPADDLPTDTSMSPLLMSSTDNRNNVRVINVQCPNGANKQVVVNKSPGQQSVLQKMAGSFSMFVNPQTSQSFIVSGSHVTEANSPWKCVTLNVNNKPNEEIGSSTRPQAHTAIKTTLPSTTNTTRIPVMVPGVGSGPNKPEQPTRPQAHSVIKTTLPSTTNTTRIPVMVSGVVSGHNKPETKNNFYITKTEDGKHLILVPVSKGAESSNTKTLLQPKHSTNVPTSEHHVRVTFDKQKHKVVDIGSRVVISKSAVPKTQQNYALPDQLPLSKIDSGYVNTVNKIGPVESTGMQLPGTILVTNGGLVNYVKNNDNLTQLSVGKSLTNCASNEQTHGKNNRILSASSSVSKTNQNWQFNATQRGQTYPVRQAAPVSASVNETGTVLKVLKSISEPLDEIAYGNNNSPQAERVSSDHLNKEVLLGKKSTESLQLNSEDNSYYATEKTVDYNKSTESNGSNQFTKLAKVKDNNYADKEPALNVRETKPKAFSEALSVREEKLKRLKKLLKEKQKAVDEIRGSTAKNE